MSQLQLLKAQIEAMDTRITQLNKEMSLKDSLITSIQQKKIDVDKQLLEEQGQYEKLMQNYNYLCEVKKDTAANFGQIEEAAITLLDILKTKCDSIS